MLSPISLLRPLVAVVVVVLITASCSSNADTSSENGANGDDGSTSTTTTTSATTTSTTTTSTTTTTTPPPPELELIGRGPYDVGVSTIVVDDGVRDRPLTVDVWFPLAAETSGALHQYTFLPGVFYESPVAITADFGDISGDGPFPLVMYSHGSGGLRYVHSRYTETLASHGYVVAAPDHTGNTTIDQILQASAEPLVTALNRPADISAVIDGLVDPESDAAPDLAIHIDAEQIAATGHSFGGFTAYALVSGYDNVNGTVPADERIDAIITLAPAASPELLTDERLAAVDVPSLVIAATDDKTTPIEPNVTRPWDLAPSVPAYRVDLIAAEHQTFTDVCAYVDYLPTLPAVPDLVADTIDDFAQAGCQPDDMDNERAQQLINTFALTFLEEVFDEGDPIDPDAFQIPDDIRLLVRSG